MQIQRISVNDEDTCTLENCKREFIMKELSGNKNIVPYMAHKVAKLPTGIYEVLVLLEYCSRGHVMDQMNKRLNRDFREEEVITIFCKILKLVVKGIVSVLISNYNLFSELYHFIPLFRIGNNCTMIRLSVVKMILSGYG